jgi:GH35 family endo-1,4-beta-xylanase
VEYLIKQQAPFDNLGSQAHGGPIAHGRNNPPQSLWKYYDELAAQSGKRLLYTELDIGIEDDQDAEQLAYQADRLRDSILIAFAHPAIDGITQWGFWQGQHWIPTAALWRKDWTIKPIGQAYIDLVYRTLWTDTSTRTARDGSAQVRGFHGDYEVTVTANGQTKTVPVTLPRAGASLKVSLGR